MEISAEDLEDLKHAKQLLENPGFGARVINLFGIPIEKGFRLLPAGWNQKVQAATRVALDRAFHVAHASLSALPRPFSNFLHKAILAMTGAAGGAFGLIALPVELPFSTIVMLRSIAEIARSEGEDLKEPGSRLACLEVFALGGRSLRDDAAETGYFLVRAALARSVSDAAAYIAERGLAEESAPVIVRLMTQLASRFGVVVSEKAAAEAVPVIGALGGAVINTIFMDHFQTMARGHFTVRRLERIYGPDQIKEIYASLP